MRIILAPYPCRSYNVSFIIPKQLAQSKLGEASLDEQGHDRADTGEPDRGPETGKVAVTSKEDVHVVVDGAAGDVGDGQRV